ncbi:MAG: urease accessory protein UreE [Cyanobacteriota bacterium]|nr:urease accessory protein UreE [Cyanobacteriota bacterium]
MTDASPTPLVLSHRLGVGPPGQGPDGGLELQLTAEERTRLRGLRRSRCGVPLLLQLPRGEALAPGEWLGSEDGRPRVRVEAAAESLLRVRSSEPLALLRAAYHLGNRHVALELQEGELRLLADPVLAHLLGQGALEVDHCLEPFLPDSGAYGAGSAPHPPHHHPVAPPPHGASSDDRVA